MTALPKTRVPEEEYLRLERAAEYKSEYYEGEIFAMAGAGRRHVIITLNIGASLHTQFKGRECFGFMSDMRVRAADGELYTYPDVAAVCGDARFLDGETDTLLNPQLLVEVLSPSTMAYDRGVKVWRYRQIESLTDYLLVSQDRILVEHGSRDLLRPHVWTVQEHSDLADHIEVKGVGAHLPLVDIYDKVDFSDAPEQTSLSR